MNDETTTFAKRNRMRRISILIETRDDAYPGPKIAQLASQPGPAGTRVPCTLCHGKGFSPRGRWCIVCEGTGWRSPRTGWAEAPIDEYVYDHDVKVKRLVDFKAGTERTTMRPEVMDAELQRLRREERERAGIIDPFDQYGWERARRAQERAGSYRELDRALELLRQRKPNVQPLSDQGLAFLAETMRGAIHLPAWLEEPLQRAESILDLADEGLSATKIARRLGMDRRTVKTHLQAARRDLSDEEAA